MKTRHILYRVQNLDKAVEEYHTKGFEVEYGSDKNPGNALIYFLCGICAMMRFWRYVLETGFGN
jgi:hypothetical protein